MLSGGKNGCQMESHREEEMTCSTFLILRNSETDDGQMGVTPKIGLNLHSSWWTASGFCLDLSVDNVEEDECWLTFMTCSGSFWKYFDDTALMASEICRNCVVLEVYQHLVVFA